MKKIFKHILILAAAILGFAACQEELADVQGVVGSLAYIVDGTQAEYVAPTRDVYHTPNGSFGNVKREVELALTKPLAHDVELTLALDNSAVSDKYNAFPEGVVKFEQTVKIPAGQKSVTTIMSVDLADLSKLTAEKYQVVLRIASASGVNVSTNSNASYMMVQTGESDVDPTTNVVTASSSKASASIKHYDDGTKSKVLEKTITVSATENALIEFDVEFAIDNSLIAAYNEANGTNYLPLPEGVLPTIKSAVMAKGSKSTSTVVTFSKEDQAKLTSPQGYLVPIVLSDAGFAQISENSGVTYLIFDVAVFEGPMTYTSVLYLGDHRMATWYKFAEPFTFSAHKYTYIFHFFIDDFSENGKMRIGNFSDADESWINMLRIGEKEKQLEWWVGPGNGTRYKLYSGALEAGKWYQAALVYNGSSSWSGTLTMYLDGNQVARQSISRNALTTYRNNPSKFQAIEFNSSWVEAYREGNEFHGRLWNVGVWNEALTQAQIKACDGGIDPEVHATASCAFWAFDDGFGYKVRQTGGNYQMGEIDFSNTTRVETESGGYEDADVSAYVQWKQDEFNNFD